jgi:ABC-type Fe3+/spermidine/putrescine transport system ATPase subunit
VRGDERPTEGAEVDAILRPEDLTIEPDPQGIGFVTHKSFLGATTRLVVQVRETPVRIDVRSDQGEELELGAHVNVKVISRDVLVAARVESSATQTA